MAVRLPDPPPHQQLFPAGGWLVNGQQRLLMQVRPQTSRMGASQVELRTFHWVPPHPPIPQNRRLLAIPDALDTWGQLQSRGWRRVKPPVL